MFFTGWIVVATLCAPSPPYGSLIDRVVAVVGTEVVTESELMIEARIALAYREGERAATADLSPELLESFRDYVIDQLSVLITARRLGGPSVSEVRVTSAMNRFRAQFSSALSYQAFLRRYGIGEDTVRGILERDLKNDVFINARLRTRLIGAQGVGTDSAEALKTWVAQVRGSLEVRVLGESGRLESIDATR